jgi:hypothetical protein
MEGAMKNSEAQVARVLSITRRLRLIIQSTVERLLIRAAIARFKSEELAQAMTKYLGQDG